MGNHSYDWSIAFDFVVKNFIAIDSVSKNYSNHTLMMNHKPVLYYCYIHHILNHCLRHIKGLSYVDCIITSLNIIMMNRHFKVVNYYILPNYKEPDGFYDMIIFMFDLMIIKIDYIKFFVSFFIIIYYCVTLPLNLPLSQLPFQRIFTF